jgi:hypothetical protein
MGPENMWGKKAIEVAKKVGIAGLVTIGGVGEAEAGGIRVDEKVVSQEKYAIAGVIKPGIDGAIEPGIDGALGNDNKITTTAEVKKSDEFSFDTPDNGGTGNFNGVSFKVAKKILKK